ncbi:CRHR2.2 family protein [Megaselia abdita]
MRINMEDDRFSDLELDSLIANSTMLGTNCTIEALKQNYNSHPSILGGCPFQFDSVLCWPSTAPDTNATLPCFDSFQGVKYDTTQNATRYCYPNGTWSNYSSYDNCKHLTSQMPIADFFELPPWIYCGGYILSLLALSVAIIIFVYFRDLRCLRNTIHTNLFVTYIFSALLWILTFFLQVMTDHPSPANCICLVILLQYFNLTNFFWMLVEGLYLYTLVVQTFSSENIKITIYALIGWICPLVAIVAWSIAKIYAEPLETEDNLFGLEIDCSWMRESHIDWIFKGPACLALLLNLVFLARIMWVLITKLRSANTQETRQYRKASKALLVLIPLLGVTYILLIFGPTIEPDHQHLFGKSYEVLRAFLISTQGFSVALLYCFLNSEVKQAVRHRLQTWNDSRHISSSNSLKGNRRYPLSKDYSQRSRTESLRTEEITVFIRP